MSFPPRQQRGSGSRMWGRCTTVICVLGLMAVSALIAWCAGKAQRNTAPIERRVMPCPTPIPTKRILMWTGFWGTDSDSWERLFFKMVQKRCPVSACELVYDHRNLFTADAVVLHIRDVLNSTELPDRRPAGQPWVAFTLEAPPAMDLFPVNYSLLRGVINWTMSYRRDSDIVVPYGTVLPRDTVGEDQATDLEEEDYWSGKQEDHQVVWMVSHCSTDSRREWYVKELAKHIRVDVVGKCGFMKCGQHISIKTLKSSDQENCDDVTNQYFFYLAFENAICEDYVTEKFFMALQRNVVPVVLGGADYASIAPPKSFINALDFASPEKLAEALNFIIANKTIYNQFFSWRRHYTVELGHPFDPMICDLCARLHNAPQQHPQLQKHRASPIPGLASGTQDLLWPNGTYRDIEDWFVKGSSCRRWWADERDFRMHQPIMPDHRHVDDILERKDDVVLGGEGHLSQTQHSAQLLRRCAASVLTDAIDLWPGDLRAALPRGWWRNGLVP
ncbi:Fucosyltransferase N-terminal [Trinorchestia longiramus]|nr:Fucosyltransferase N-terminal [Trinorchestia longiramus]